MRLAAALLMSTLSVPALAHGGFSGGHSGGAHFSGGGAHSSSAPHFSSGASAHYSAHYATPAVAHGYNYGTARATGYVGAGHVAASVGRTVGTPGWRGSPGWQGGRAAGPGYAHLGAWGGGYWGGRFWPGAYYGPAFAWFLPTIPLYCATYWWNSVPYYYYNDAYYTWSPTADGYVATDPPPVASTAPVTAGPDGSVAPAADNAASAPEPIPPGQFAAQPGAAANTAANGGGSDHVFAYPTGGQSEQQQAADRTQCDQWAASQSSSPSDYRRAVIACFQARGYSAQ